MKNAVIAALVVALGVSIAVGVIAEASRTVNVEVRVWQDVDDAGAFWLSARPDGGSWADLGTIPVPLDDGLSGTGRYRYGDVTLALSVPPAPSCADASLAADCAVLLAARDALAGDGALNWSADVPVTEWDGVTVSGTPRRVTGLDLRNRGLTGSIPPELGRLPPSLRTVYLAGNAFTGCVPERLRLVENNDLEPLMVERRIWYCPVPPIRWSAIPPGTYHFADALIVDIPASDLEVDLCGLLHVDFATPEDIPEGQSNDAVCFGDLDGRWEMYLDRHYAVEWGRYPTDPDTDGSTLPADVDALFNQIAATARPAPLPSCWDEPDCAVLRAARDTLAGDGMLNWSADIHMRRWDGVTIADWAWSPPWRVTKLDLRNRGLTGSIPPELGSLPPSLWTVYLAGNAFTGCVPERLRLAAANDLEVLMMERELRYCPLPEVPENEEAISPGTYQLGDSLVVDIPANEFEVTFCGIAAVERLPVPGQGYDGVCFGDLDGRWAVWLDRYYAVEWWRYSADADEQALPAEVDALFDRIAKTARLAPPPPCWDELACALLWAARDTLAGDGTLNWSADIPMWMWDGVTVSGISRGVAGLGLDLRNRGLTGSIPPELGSLPPTLATLYLAGNAFTGCVPERLRLAENNDLERLMAERSLSWCPVAAMPWSEEAIPPGTYQVQGNIIVDIPVATVQAKISSIYASDGGPGSGRGYCFSDLAERWEVCLDASSGEEILRAVPPQIHSSGANGASSSTPPAEVDALLDQIAATARPAPP